MPKPILIDELLKENEQANAAEQLKQLQFELQKKRAEVVPPDWKTSARWAREAGKSRCTTAATLADAAEQGLVERKQFLVATAQGVRKVWHYRIPEKRNK